MKRIRYSNSVKMILLSVLLCLSFSISLKGQVSQKDKIKPPLTRILFIFDASYSMMGKWQSDLKITVAQRILCRLLDSLAGEENLEIALRVYGHQSSFPPQDCNDTRLEIPFAKDNIPRIKNRLKSITPKGTTPIARSLEQSINDFPKAENVRNIIILITDGLEECDGDPCAVSLQLQKKGIFLKPFVIGIGITNFAGLNCVGQLYDAESENMLYSTLDVVIKQALNKTSAQINLLDSLARPTETDVALTLSDYFSGKRKYNFIHTMNSRGNPDTLIIDHLSTYNMIVHTIPPIHLDSITLSPGKHNIIAIDAPQGYLKLQVKGMNTYGKLNCIVRQHGQMPTLHVQQFDQTIKYLTGKYDLEILTLPRIYVYNTAISQNKTTTVEVPEPGLVTITAPSPGFGSIFLENGDEMEFVCRMNEKSNSETLLLQPGNYRIIFRIKSIKETIYTIEKSFKVTSGTAIPVKL